MATRNLVPRANGEGSLGRADKKWGAIYAGELHVDTILSEKTPTKGTDLANKLYVDEQDASTLQAAKDNTTQAVNSLKTQIQQEYLKKEEASATYLTQVNASTTYLKQSDANANYLKKTDAESTYLKQSDANANYLKKTDAESTYLKQSDANSDYVAKNGVYLKSGTEQNGTVSLLKGDGTYFKFDRSINLMKRNTSYVVGDVAVSPNLPRWAYLECTEAGTTSDSDPEFSEITPGKTVNDGTASFIVRDIKQAAKLEQDIPTVVSDHMRRYGDNYSIPNTGAELAATGDWISYYDNLGISGLTNGILMHYGTKKSGEMKQMFQSNSGEIWMRSIPASSADVSSVEFTRIGPGERMVAFNNNPEYFGYAKYDSGLMITWGATTVPANTTDITVVFPQPYKENTCCMTATAISGQGNEWTGTTSVSVISNTSFIIKARGNGEGLNTYSILCHWHAIGWWK